MAELTIQRPAPATRQRPRVDRQLRAYEQAHRYLVFPQAGSQTAWDVVKLDGTGSYSVDPVAGRCNCPDHIGRGAICKHIHLVRIHVAAEAERPPSSPAAPRTIPLSPDPRIAEIKSRWHPAPTPAAKAAAPTPKPWAELTPAERRVRAFGPED